MDDIEKLGDVIDRKTNRITELQRENHRLQEVNGVLNEWYADLKHLALTVVRTYDLDPESREFDRAISQLRVQAELPAERRLGPEVNE